MDMVGFEFFEEALVVGDRQDTKRRICVREFFDSTGHGLHGVDVETRVDLVEDRKLGLEYPELHCFVALLLAARQVDIERTGNEFGVKTNAFCFLGDGLADCLRLSASSNRGGLQHGLEGHAGHFGWVLHGEEKTSLGPFPCGEFQ